MNAQQFIDFGKSTVDFIADYTENLRDRNVLPNVEPGYLNNLIPREAPEKPESWQDVLKDIERVILPGITHWNSPRFHAYYPTANSYPAIIGELLSAGIGCIGFSWISSPACTELEVIALNWLGKLIALPSEFLSCGEGPGGGVIQGSASEATLLCILAAKSRTIRRIKALHPDWDEKLLQNKLIVYSSDQSNSSVEKAGLLASVSMTLLPTDKECSLRGEALSNAIKKDLERGLIPCCVIATLGTTGTCAFDNLEELGSICKEHDIWLHVDAAYAASAFVCPEFRHYMKGVELADSFNFNPSKWLLVNFDCSALWVKDANWLIDAFNVDRIYLAHDKQGLAPDYRHWQIPLGRRFRSLKLWFVMRLYGIEGLQKHIRTSVRLARIFEDLVISDDRFEIVFKAVMGLVCFRIKGENCLTKTLIDRLMARKQIYVIAAMHYDKLFIRFVIASRFCQEEDIIFSWNEIVEQTDQILPPEVPQICSDKSLINGISSKYKDDVVSRIEELKLEADGITQKIS